MAAAPGVADARRLTRGQAPNVVIVLTDDLDTGTLNQALAEGLMPVLDAEFVQKGTTFSNAFVTNSLCCPSRATLLSGQYSHNHGVFTNAPPYGFGAFQDGETLATWMQGLGYNTGLIGKYLNGYFAEDQYVPPGWDHWRALVDNSAHLMYDYLITDTVTTVRNSTDYQTDFLAQEAVNFVNTATPPFFLLLAPTAPHPERGPSQYSPPALCSLTGGTSGNVPTIRPPPRYDGMAAALPVIRNTSVNEEFLWDKPIWLRQWVNTKYSDAELECIDDSVRDKFEAMAAVDDLLGDLLEALTVNGYTDTIVVFTSDNGYMHGEHRLLQKTQVYEEAIRVPFYLRDLSTASAETVAQAVLNNDIAPTLVELAGGTPHPQIDGRSFLPLLSGGAPAWRKRFLVEHYPTGADRIPEYFAIRGVAGKQAVYVEYRVPGSAHGNGSNGCDPDYCEYYDMDVDPPQLFSYHRRPSVQPVIEKLQGILPDFKICAGDTCRELEDRQL